MLIEKPSTTTLADSERLVREARERGLALHENYMFQYHAQLEDIAGLLDEGVVGDVRLYRADFGFPLRAANDFRYLRELGGGALLDAGGYVIKLATLLLGPTARVEAAELRSLPGYEVDMVGSVTLVNDEGLVFQGGFGMDCGYRCRMEVWGSTGTLTTDRVFTAPTGFVPHALVQTNAGVSDIEMRADAHFEKSIAAEQAAIQRSEAKLSGKFAEHAPAEVVQAEKDKLEESRRRVEKLSGYVREL